MAKLVQFLRDVREWLIGARRFIYAALALSVIIVTNVAPGFAPRWESIAGASMILFGVLIGGDFLAEMVQKWNDRPDTVEALLELLRNEQGPSAAITVKAESIARITAGKKPDTAGIGGVMATGQVDSITDGKTIATIRRDIQQEVG